MSIATIAGCSDDCVVGPESVVLELSETGGAGKVDVDSFATASVSEGAITIVFDDGRIEGKQAGLLGQVPVGERLRARVF